MTELHYNAQGRRIRQDSFECCPPLKAPENETAEEERTRRYTHTCMYIDLLEKEIRLAFQSSGTRSLHRLRVQEALMGMLETMNPLLGDCSITAKPDYTQEERMTASAVIAKFEALKNRGAIEEEANASEEEQPQVNEWLIERKKHAMRFQNEVYEWAFDRYSERLEKDLNSRYAAVPAATLGALRLAAESQLYAALSLQREMAYLAVEEGLVKIDVHAIKDGAKCFVVFGEEAPQQARGASSEMQALLSGFVSLQSSVRLLGWTAANGWKCPYTAKAE